MYQYTQFGSTALPSYEAQSDVGPLSSQDMRVRTAQGVYDAGGTAQLRPGETVISHRGTMVSDDDADMESDARALAVLRGTYAKLYREWRDGGTEWIWARCIAVRGRRQRGMYLHQDWEFQFLALSPTWNGTAHDDDTTLNSSPKALTVTNGGDAVVRNAVITVTAGGANITALTIAAGSAEISYSGTITAGQALVIDCGALTVKNNGTGDYANFSLTVNHTVIDWMPLEPGNNSVTVTFTGGSTDSVVNFAFYDGWH